MGKRREPGVQTGAEPEDASSEGSRKLIAGTIEGRGSTKVGRRLTATARGFISDGSRGLMIAGKAGRGRFRRKPEVVPSARQETRDLMRLGGWLEGRAGGFDIRRESEAGSEGKAGGCDTR